MSDISFKQAVNRIRKELLEDDTLYIEYQLLITKSILYEIQKQSKQRQDVSLLNYYDVVNRISKNLMSLWLKPERKR